MKKDSAAEISAINELWRLQREYRQRRDPQLAFKALQLASASGFRTPPWVSACLDAIASKVSVKPQTEAELIADAFGFMPGDFQQADYDTKMMARLMTLEARAKASKQARSGGKARARKLTKARKSEIAKAGAAARWKDHTPSPKPNTRTRKAR